ncbi:MAG: hypothetical protein ACF8R7_07550 [Phycisphaerales bacterium JB039]
MIAAPAIAIVAALGAQDAEPMAIAVRGIAGAVEFELAGEPLRAKPALSVTAPMVVRIVDASAIGEGSTRYRVAFIGTVAGDYDLRDLLERQDGSALDGQPLMVRVVSQLPPDHGTDLFSESSAPPMTPSRYRAAMIALGAAWVAIPVIYLGVRIARRRPPAPPAPQAPAPTLAEQLRPLVESAMAGTLAVEGRGRLELLLYMHWRRRLDLEGPQAQAVATLRRHPEAGRLLRAVEAWLHARPDGAARPQDDVAALLAPYRAAPAIAEADAEARP